MSDDPAGIHEALESEALRVAILACVDRLGRDLTTVMLRAWVDFVDEMRPDVVDLSENSYWLICDQCGLIVALPPVAPGRVSIEPIRGWVFSGGEWRCCACKGGIGGAINPPGPPRVAIGSGRELG